jgi:hypothetical protein
MNIYNSPSRLLSCLALPLCVIATISRLDAQIALTSANNTYDQDFNSLVDVNIGSSTFYDWVNNYTIPGWYAALTDGEAISRIRATNGPTSRNTTPLSISRSSGTEGALTLTGGTFTNDSVKHGMFGVYFVNAGTTTITSLTISYRGEQWAHMSGSEDRLDFQYSLDATSLSDGTWIDHNALDFVALKTSSSSPTQINGNSSGNYTSISATITGLSLAPGQTFWLRWVDFDGPDEEQVLGVDNFTLSATFASSIPEPSGYALAAGIGILAVVASRRRRR